MFGAHPFLIARSPASMSLRNPLQAPLHSQTKRDQTFKNWRLTERQAAPTGVMLTVRTQNADFTAKVHVIFVEIRAMLPCSSEPTYFFLLNTRVSINIPRQKQQEALAPTRQIAPRWDFCACVKLFSLTILFRERQPQACRFRSNRQKQKLKQRKRIMKNAKTELVIL